MYGDMPSLQWFKGALLNMYKLRGTYVGKWQAYGLF